MTKSGILEVHGTNALSITSIVDNGYISASYDSTRHEFSSPEVYCAQLTDPSSPQHKSAPYHYGTVSCIFPEDAPKWDLEQHWPEDKNEEMKTPLVKFVWILEETTESTD